MERYILPDVFDSGNQVRKAEEFLYFSGEEVNLNQCDKKLSSGASMLWKKAVKSFSLHFYCGVVEEHIFKFTLGREACCKMLEYFYHSINQNNIFSLSTLPTGRGGDSYTAFPAISAAAQFLIWNSASNLETITLITFNSSTGSLWC